MAISVASRATYLNCAFKPGYWAGDVPPVAFYDPVNFTKLEITSQTQEADNLTSNIDGSIGENLASVQKPTDSAKLSAEVNFMAAEMFALLIGADLSEIAQTTATVTDEAVTLSVGLWVPLASQYIDATGITLKTSADVTIAPTEYAVDTISGLVKALTATGATGTKISYSKAARTGERYNAGKAKSAYVMLVGTGTEKVSKKRCRVVIHKASLAGSGAFDPVTGTYTTGTLEGNLITPSTESSPWQYEYLDLSA